MELVIGIDEAGRGPLAGPVAVGVAMVSDEFDWDLLPGVNDSKKLTEEKREVIFLAANALQKNGKLDFAVSMVSAKMIDQIGIVDAVNRGIERALRQVEKHRLNMAVNSHVYDTFTVKLDGGLRAPERYIHQKTIIKGDQKEKIIGLASIMAKVTRDRYMRWRAALAAYEAYNFAIHKGYGTQAHREAIQKNGLSDEHRKSFCTNITNPTQP